MRYNFGSELLLAGLPTSSRDSGSTQMKPEEIILVLQNVASVTGAATRPAWEAPHHAERRAAQAASFAGSLVMQIIRGRGKLILLLAALSAMFAQGSDLTIKSQSPIDAPDVRHIVEASIAATMRSWQRRLLYTYVERDEDRRLDSEGHVKSAQVDVSRIALVNGVPFEQLVERNGRPPSAAEERKQKERLDKLMRETPERRTERLRKEEEESTSLVREIPKAFDFHLAGEELVNGVSAYVLDATPHSGYQPQGKYGKIFSKLKGKLWVDKQTFGWIKANGQVIEPFSLGLFLVRLLPGSRIAMEQTRVDDGNWVPERVEVRAAAKIFILKSLVINRVLTYSEFSVGQPGVPVMPDNSKKAHLSPGK